MDQSGKFELQDPSSQSQEDPELQDNVDGQWISRDRLLGGKYHKRKIS